jgi:hypothetical protein
VIQAVRIALQKEAAVVFLAKAASNSIQSTIHARRSTAQWIII